MALRLRNENGLLGDALGTIPVMIAVSQIEGPGNLYISGLHHEARQIWEMFPKKYGVTFEFPEYPVIDLAMDEKNLDLVNAFRLSSVMNYHMTQAHFPLIGLPVPEKPIRPELEVPDLDVPVYDFIIAPFSRSLPPDQKWTQDKWQTLVKMFPDKKFALFGNPVHDDPNYLVADNVTPEFGRPLAEVCNILMKARYGCISVVTGISHFCHALGVPNILLVNQGAWGKNPDGILVTERIPQVFAPRVALEMHKLILAKK